MREPGSILFSSPVYGEVLSEAVGAAPPLTRRRLRRVDLSRKRER